MAVGTGQTRLVVLRGNSGSGKSSVAAALRAACGPGVAWVSQDLIRRVILKEKDQPGGLNIGLIDQVTRYALTLRRHAMRPQAAEFGTSQMREWYRPRDLLTAVREQVIPQASPLKQTTACSSQAVASRPCRSKTVMSSYASTSS